MSLQKGDIVLVPFPFTDLKLTREEDGDRSDSMDTKLTYPSALLCASLCVPLR
ncbi:MAG: hypothetical protein ICV54_01085 [Nostoc sp. C3-bin3]|nr:hypothetical protein [Nostoc sp. C3-bin3]